jgi:hypothetical protein
VVVLASVLVKETGSASALAKEMELASVLAKEMESALAWLDQAESLGAKRPCSNLYFVYASDIPWLQLSISQADWHRQKE